MEHLPEQIVIRNCIIGKNLNLAVISGFAKIDLLSDISSADVFDQTHNKFGTQRELKPGHAKEATEYALGSVEADPFVDPRAFTEVILNVRDASTVAIQKNGQPLNFLSLSYDVYDSEPVDLIVNTRLLGWPQPKYQPQISRVDGNHRLSEIPLPAERDDAEFPLIPFALFVGLTNEQERKVFRDINGTQAKMNTAHLAQILITLEGDNSLLNEKTRGLWFARKLSSPGMAFEGMVFEGGSKKGVKEAHGTVPPITLNGLQSMMNETLGGMESAQAELFPDDVVAKAKDGDEFALEELIHNGNKLADVMNNFWNAVKKVFPEPWQDKKNYILLQSIGSQSTSKFAGILMTELLLKGSAKLEVFENELNKIKHVGFSYSKDDWAGYAGAAGAAKVFKELLDKRIEGGTKILPNL